MDIGKALVLSQDILSGKLAKTIELAKEMEPLRGRQLMITHLILLIWVDKMKKELKGT